MEGGAFYIGNAVTSVKVTAATVHHHHVSWFDVQFVCRRFSIAGSAPRRAAAAPETARRTTCSTTTRAPSLYSGTPSSSAPAAPRSSSRNQFRIRCRRNEWNGILRMNINEGNSMTSFRSRWIIWMITGTASVAKPSKNKGARKPLSAPDSISLASQET